MNNVNLTKMFFILIGPFWGGLCGFTLSTAGVHTDNWQFWVILVGSILFGCGQYAHGILRGQEIEP